MALSIQANIKNYQSLKAKVEESKGKTEKAVKATVRDMKSRAPGKIATRVSQRYSIKKSEVMPKSASAKKPQKRAGGVKVSGETLETLTFTYTGSTLTPTHFKMKPGNRPAGNKPYSVTAEIMKGSRKSLGPSVFLGSNNGSGAIPFQRKGEERLPIKAVKTVSVPQMVGEEQVAEGVQEDLQELLQQRLQHNMDRQHGK